MMLKLFSVMHRTLTTISITIVTIISNHNLVVRESTWPLTLFLLYIRGDHTVVTLYISSTTCFNLITLDDGLLLDRLSDVPSLVQHTVMFGCIKSDLPNN